MNVYLDYLKLRPEFSEFIQFLLAKYSNNPIILNYVASIYESGLVSDKSKDISHVYFSKLYAKAAELGYFRAFINLFSLHVDVNSPTEQAFNIIKMGYDLTNKDILIEMFFSKLFENYEKLSTIDKPINSRFFWPSKLTDYIFMSRDLHLPSSAHLLAYLITIENKLSGMILEVGPNFKGSYDLDGYLAFKLLNKYGNNGLGSSSKDKPFFGKTIPVKFQIDQQRVFAFFPKLEPVNYISRVTGAKIDKNVIDKAVEKFITTLIEQKKSYREAVPYFYNREQEIFLLLFDK